MSDNSNFEAMRQLATILGVSSPESNDQIFNTSFINTIKRAAKRAFTEDYAKTQLDADRFNALIVSPFRIIGYAGLQHEDPKLPCPDHGKDGYAHFGCEIWTSHGTKDNEAGKDIITGFADQAIIAQALKKGSE